MIKDTAFNPNGGVYNVVRVDHIERTQVSEAMIDLALTRSWNFWHGKQTRKSRLADPWQRARTRRNIALGLSCGSYKGGSGS